MDKPRRRMRPEHFEDFSQIMNLRGYNAVQIFDQLNGTLPIRDLLLDHIKDSPDWALDSLERLSVLILETARELHQKGHEEIANKLLWWLSGIITNEAGQVN